MSFWRKPESRPLLSPPLDSSFRWNDGKFENGASNRGVAPLVKIFPLSFEGEGGTGSEVETMKKKWIKITAIILFLLGTGFILGCQSEKHTPTYGHTTAGSLS